MKRHDLTIGQRFGLGFGVVLVLLAAELAISAAWLGGIGKLQGQERDVVAPRLATAEALESAILYRAISVRNYTVIRDPEYLRTAETAWVDGRAALRQLETFRKTGDEIPISEVLSSAEAYDSTANSYIALVRQGAAGSDVLLAEREVASARERLLRATRGYAALLRGRTEAARVATMEAERRTRTGLAWLAGLVLATFLTTAWLVTRSVRRPTRQLVEAARGLAAGNYGPAAVLEAEASNGRGPPRDEMRELATSFGRMASALRNREERLEAHLRLSAALASNLEVERVADAALREIVAYAGAELGGAWILDPGPVLRRVASFALGDDAATLSIGDGIPGEAVAAGRVIQISDIPADTPFHVRFGFDAVPPRSLVAAPIPFQGRTAGVVLLGSVREVSAEAVAFLEEAVCRLGVGLQNALAHRELQGKSELLQAQNEELQAQQEEIQAQNEELQAQREEIQVQNEELQAQTEELQSQSESLRETVERLARADHQKNEFLATLSHELRNPLAAISAAAHLIERHAAGDPTAHQAAIVSRQARHLARIVDDLLDVSRITHGKLELRRAPLDLGQVLRNACEAARSLMDARGHELAISVGDGPLLVDGDRDRLEQVLANLFHNAAKFTRPGGRISALVAREGAEVVLRVRDTGIGIAPELLPRLFDLFQQGDGNSSKEGLGVGLTLVRRLVEMHGGRIEAASEGPERGSEFVVRLPALVEAAEPAPAKSDEPPAGDSKPLQILIVDDNADLASSMADLVAEWGHEVTVHGTARAALDAALASPPDVVLLDLRLPDMDGHEVARQLRTRFGRDAPPRLIALTGCGLPDDQRRTREAGFDVHLVKPVPIEELRSTLARLAASAPEP